MSAGLRHVVAQAIADRGLWQAGDRVAVAVSGGLDSMCLLRLLHETVGMHRGVLSVVTVDHGTRPGSAQDAAFVVQAAQALGLQVTVVTRALGQGAAEATCRAARYAALDALDVDAVALAHHRDDQAETALLGLMRGGGTRAIAGMAWRRGRYVRPLLDTPKDALQLWAARHELTWRTDPSNATADFLRNRVRHEVLPLLESMRAGAGVALARGAAHAAADDAWLSCAAAAAEPWDGSWPTSWLIDGPSPLVRRAILARLPDAQSAHLDAILAAARRGRGRVFLSPSVSVVVDGVAVRIEGADAEDNGLPLASGPDRAQTRKRRCRDGTAPSGDPGVPER